MRARPVLLAVISLLVAVAPAHAATKRLTLRAGPFNVNGFQTVWPSATVDNTGLNGYITKMDAELVDARGRRVLINKVMLHHVVFIDSARHYNSCPGRKGTPFFGTGEENEKLVLPAGYGYRTHKHDSWRMVAMFMSHHLQAKTVYLQYHVTVMTSPPTRRLTDVLPMWLRADGCKVEPAYDINGDGDAAQHNLQTTAWKMPPARRRLRPSRDAAALRRPNDRQQRAALRRAVGPRLPRVPGAARARPGGDGLAAVEGRHPRAQGRAAERDRRLRPVRAARPRHGDHAPLRRARQPRARGLRAVAVGHPNRLDPAARPQPAAARDDPDLTPQRARQGRLGRPAAGR
jgi:hypothetical protein